MPFFVIYILIAAVGFFIPSEKRQKTVLLISCIFLFVLLSFRSAEVGTDTRGYCEEFLKYGHYSWEKVFSLGTNYGFYIFNKLLSYIFPNGYTGYLTVVAFITSISIWYFLKNNSEDYALSQVMLLSLGFILFFFSGIKQTLAMSILFFAYEKLKRKKFLAFILLTISAALFHNTALIFLLALPVFVLKGNKKLLLLAPILIILCYIFRSQITEFIKSILGDEFYSQYGDAYKSQNNLTGFFIQLVIIIASCVLYYTSSYRDEQYEKVIGIYVIGICFQCMTGIIAEFFRISMYFSVYGAILFPNALRHSRFERNSKTMVRVLSFLFFAAYFIAFSGRGFIYTFVW